MLTVKQGIQLSAIADKLGLKIENAKSGQEEVGAALMMQIVSKAHLAEEEIYSFIASVKGCTAEQAANMDLVAVLKELATDTGVAGFFASAVKSQLRG